MLIGIDEVGRGAWAGPLAVGAAGGDLTEVSQLLRRRSGEGYYDSKALTPKRRQSVLLQLRAAGVSYGVGFARASEIDLFGLTKALAMAAERALEQLSFTMTVASANPWHILLDGKSNYLGERQADTIVGGDRAHPLIAAASIVAKVARDELMKNLDDELPYWDFESSKGYGSMRHRYGLIWQGPSIEHRRSFRPVRELAMPCTAPFFLKS